MAKVTLTVGWPARTKIRARLDFHNLTWTEYKGLLQSSFSAKGDDNDVRAFYEWLRQEFQ